MHQRCGHVTFGDGCSQIFLLPADHAINEVCKVFLFFFSSVRSEWAGLLISSHPGPVTTEAAVYGQVSLWSIENIADGIVVAVAAETRVQILGAAPAQLTVGSAGVFSRCRGRFACIRGGSNFSLRVCHPMANLEFDHLALSVWQIILEGAIEDVRSLLIIVEHEMATHG